MTKIKICGITNLEDALAAAEYGADAVGFIFYAGSRRFIDPESVSEITKKLPPFLKKIGVFVNEEPERVIDITDIAGLDIVQLHGDETPHYCRDLNFPHIKSFRVKDSLDPDEIRKFDTPFVLFDTYSEKEYGGTGSAFNWNLLKDKQLDDKYVIISGGLDPGNVSEGIKKTMPYAVDVSSGVELSPGKKDKEKIKNFIEAVRNGN